MDADGRSAALRAIAGPRLPLSTEPTAGPGKPTRRLGGDFTPSSAWPYIEEFVESGGNIQIGPITPIECAAVAADPHGIIAA
jgi:hypothetical protein